MRRGCGMDTLFELLGCKPAPNCDPPGLFNGSYKVGFITSTYYGCGSCTYSLRVTGEGEGWYVF